MIKVKADFVFDVKLKILFFLPRKSIAKDCISTDLTFKIVGKLKHMGNKLKHTTKIHLIRSYKW